MTLENSTRHHGGHIPANSHDRAPSHKKPTLPPIDDLAEMLRGGEHLDTLAAQFERVPDTLRLKLNRGGYSVTGDPITRAERTIPLILMPFDDQPWADQARCNQTDPEAFFPVKGGTTRHAKAVCLTCDVRLECLKYALANDERFGVWGGLSERERRRLKRDRAAS